MRPLPVCTPRKKVSTSSSSLRCSLTSESGCVIFLHLFGVIGNVRRGIILLIMRLNVRSCSFQIIWRRLSWKNYLLCWCIGETLHIEMKCPGLKLCCLLTHAALTDGPFIVRSHSHMVFLSGIELTWNSMKRIIR